MAIRDSNAEGLTEAPGWASKRSVAYPLSILMETIHIALCIHSFRKEGCHVQSGMGPHIVPHIVHVYFLFFGCILYDGLRENLFDEQREATLLGSGYILTDRHCKL